MIGKGTSESPYIVSTAEDFIALEGMMETTAENPCYIKLENDIDFSEYTDGYGGLTISSGVQYINLDGRNHKIIHFYQTAGDTGGLFTGTVGGVIKNIELSGFRIETSYIGSNPFPIGGFAPMFESINLSNVIVTGEITAPSLNNGAAVGGIFGKNASSGATFTADNCITKVNTSGGFYVGGFVGLMTSVTAILSRCSSACRINWAYDYGGGFIGWGYGGEHTFDFCYSKSEFGISGTSFKYCGGFAGETCLTTLNNCVTESKFIHEQSTNNTYCGGFCSSAKFTNYNSQILQCYSRASFKNINTVTGFIRSSDGTTNKRPAQIRQSYSAIMCIDCSTVYPFSDYKELYNSFYDSDILTSSADTDGAETTANLKSAEWLRSQGWAI